MIYGLYMIASALISWLFTLEPVTVSSGYLGNPAEANKRGPDQHQPAGQVSEQENLQVNFLPPVTLTITAYMGKQLAITLVIPNTNSL